MEAWLETAAHGVGLIIEAIALVIIAWGSLQAVIAGVGVMVSRSATQHEKRHVWLDYSRWLVAGLTFQLAADIVHTSIAPTWDDVGRLAAVAAIRTFLSFFLERDMAEMRELQRDGSAAVGEG
jgi:uncharacterized membrane protein